MILYVVTVGVRDFLLRSFDFFADEFDDLAGFYTHHVIVMLTGVKFIISLAAFEIMFLHQAGRFELIEHPVYGRQADFFTGIQQATIYVVSGQVLVALTLENFKNPFAGMGDLEAGLPEITGFHSYLLSTFIGISLFALVALLYHSRFPQHARVRPVTSMIIRSLFCLLFVSFTAAGCGLIYKQNIQQGNALEQDDLDELYEGMNQRQVLFVLGTPSVRDPFHPDRWDYVQTFSRRGGDMVQRTVTLRFEDGLLTEIAGQDDPFAASSGRVSAGSDEVASFVKQPEENPQDASIESAEEELLSTDPDIDTINERTSEDRDYQREQEVLDQTPDDNLSGPDIDG